MDHRTAYFEDFDGKYYETTISAVQSDAGKMIYNIGQMKEEASPKVKGSSAETGNAPRGLASSDTSIRTSGRESQGKYSPDSENDRRKATQFAVIQSGNAAEDDYHTWIRSADEIKTFDEALRDPEWADYDSFDPDYTAARGGWI